MFSQIAPPAVSVVQPALPVVQPALPVVQPALPVVQPAVSVVQPAVSVVQPAVSVVQPAMVISPMSVPDHLCYSVFTTLCCFLPLGIAAIAYSCSTKEANMVGDRLSAMSYSRTALILNNLALGIGLTIITLFIILRFTVL